MEYIRTSNLGLADHFMAVARSLCGTTETSSSSTSSSSAAHTLRTPGLATPAARSSSTTAANAAAAASNRDSSSNSSASGDTPQDPLVLNEMGVLAYRRGEYASAAELFTAG
jgi:hypothetical protein